MGNQLSSIILILITLFSCSHFVLYYGVVTGNTSIDTVIYAQPYDFSTYSAFSIKSHVTQKWLSAVYGSLLHRSVRNNRNWVPDLAKEMPLVSSDRLTYTFDLKQNLIFSNGEPLNTRDIQFSFHMAITPSINQANYQKYIGYLDNDSLSIISSTSFSISLLTEHAFPYELMSFPIVSSEVYKLQYQSCLNGVNLDCEFNNPNGSSTISDGPFMVESIDSSKVTLVENQYWYDAAKLKTKTLVFVKISTKSEAMKSLSNGSISIMDPLYNLDVNDGKDIDGIHHETIDYLETYEMAINNLNPYFGTGMMIPNTIINGPNNQSLGFENARLLRHAMSAIFNRTGYISKFMGQLASPAATIMPPTSFYWNGTVSGETYNLTYAKGIMSYLGFNFTELGSPDINDAYQKKFFNITILAPNTIESENQIPIAYQSTLPMIGIGVTQFVTLDQDEINNRVFASRINPQSFEQGGYDLMFFSRLWDLDWNPGNMFSSSGSCEMGDCSNIYNFDLGENMTTIAQDVKNYLFEFNIENRSRWAEIVQRDITYYLPTIAILNSKLHMIWANDVILVDGLLLSMGIQDWGQVVRQGFQNSDPNHSTINHKTPILNFLFVQIGVFMLLVHVRNCKNRIKK